VASDRRGHRPCRVIDAAFRDGAVQLTAITKILAPVCRFGESGEHAAEKQTVVGKLGEFFDRFFGLS
jgi:type I restriction enzyme R subunit